MAQPHSLPICSGSGCTCQGSPALKPRPSVCILPEHTPAGATGSEHLQLGFFLCRNDNFKVLSWQMLRNIDQNHTGYIFLLLCLSFPVWAIYSLILSTLFPSLSPSISTLLFSHATPFHPTQFGSSTKSVLPTTNWKNISVSREHHLPYNRLLC